MGVVMKREFIELDRKREKFGFLPKMATHSKCSMGSLQASGYAERINSCANQICTDGNSLLATNEISKVVVLCMNRSFIKFMRKNYPHLGKVTSIKPDSDSDSGSDDDCDY